MLPPSQSLKSASQWPLRPNTSESCQSANASANVDSTQRSRGGCPGLLEALLTHSLEDLLAASDIVSALSAIGASLISLILASLRGLPVPGAAHSSSPRLRLLPPDHLSKRAPISAEAPPVSSFATYPSPSLPLLSPSHPRLFDLYFPFSNAARSHGAPIDQDAFISEELPLLPDPAFFALVDSFVEEVRVELAGEEEEPLSSSLSALDLAFHSPSSSARRKGPASHNRIDISTLSREEAVERKRSQNRNAARRYRVKLKAKKIGELEEVDLLEERNESLRQQEASLSAEIERYKGLLLAKAGSP